MPPDPPVPLYASVISPGSFYRVTFNKPLGSAPLSAANWFVTHNATDYNPYTATPSHNTVALAVLADVTFTPPEGISYYAAPPDLIGLNGLPVAAFSKIPFI